MNCIKCKKDLPDGSVFCPWCGRKQVMQRPRKRRTSGSGSISKLSGKRANPYLARLNGVTVGTYPTVRDAERALSRLVDADVTDKYNWTLKQVYEAWKPEHAAVLEARAQTKGTGTTGMTSYETAYNGIPQLHDRVFRNIRKGELQKVLNDMRETLSVSSTEKTRQLFGQLYRWAMAEHIVTTNLAESLTIKPETKVPVVFTADEIKKITKSDLPAAKIAVILMATGVRIGELFSVRLEDCHDAYFIGGSKTAAGVNRLVPVAPAGLEAYRELRSKSRGPLLIDGYSGNKEVSNFRSRDYYPMLESLGIPKKSPHKLRHYYATAAVKAGVRPELLKEMIGHASYSTTIDIYTHQSEKDLLRAAKKIKL